MKKIFNYTKFSEDRLNTLVESFGALCDAAIAQKNNTKEYKEANKAFNEEFMKECCSAMPSFNEDTFSLEDIKNPMVHRNMFFLERFDTILAQALTPVIPTVVAQGYEDLYDVTQVGYGDNAKYRVDSNELFIVNDAAKGIARGGVMTQFNTEYTVTASKKEVAVYCDWYHAASNKLDWGNFGMKCGVAYAMYVQGKVVKALESCITSGGASQGISGYIANGFSDTNWLNI